MILRDGSIRAAMQRLEDPLIVDPGFDPRRLQPASLELTLAKDILVENLHCVRNAQGVWPQEHEERVLPQTLGFGNFWLASTIERIHMPRDLVAQVNGKSSLGRRGLVIHQTAGFIDPGFRGTITLEISNTSVNPIRLEAGMVICQLVFMQMDGPAERPYGSAGLGSHYQGQTGATASRSGLGRDVGARRATP